jgi:hypothetical protein
MPSETTRLPPRTLLGRPELRQIRKPTGDFKRESASERRPFKPKPPKPWSHQSNLTAAKGKRIEIMFGVDDGIAGILLEADQFALEIEVSNSDGSIKSVLTVFKHDIRFFRVV